MIWDAYAEAEFLGHMVTLYLTFEELLDFFHGGRTVSHSHWPCPWVSILPHPWQRLLFSISDYSHPSGCDVVHFLFDLLSPSFSFLKNDFIYLFLERGERRDKEGEKHWCKEKQLLVVSHTAPTGNLACSLGMCPDQESNPWPFGLWDHVQPTEPHLITF